MPTPRLLLTLTAAVEIAVGLALGLAPGTVVGALLRAKPGKPGRMIGRLTGAALVSLGIACWGARADSGDAAWWGTLRAATFYNGAAGLLLGCFAVSGKARGPVTWADRHGPSRASGRVSRLLAPRHVSHHGRPGR